MFFWSVVPGQNAMAQIGATQSTASDSYKGQDSYRSINERTTYYFLANDNFYERIFHPALQRQLVNNKAWNAFLKSEEPSGNHEEIQKLIRLAEETFDNVYHSFQCSMRRKAFFKSTLLNLSITSLMLAPAIYIFAGPLIKWYGKFKQSNSDDTTAMPSDDMEEWLEKQNPLTLALAGPSILLAPITVFGSWTHLSQSLYDNLPYFMPRKLADQFYDSDQFATPILPLMRQYAAKRILLPKLLQDKIDGMFQSFWMLPNDIGSYHLEKFLDIALNLPVARINLEFNEGLIQNIFQDYEQNVADNFMDFIFNAIINQHESEAGSNHDTRYPLYLIGKPGTGKTHSLKLLSQAFGGLPIA